MSIPTTQKAILATQPGTPLTLVTDHPVPKPSAKQVLIKVSITGFNPHDQKARDWGLLIKDNLPAVLTNDVAGTVVALGPEVTKYKVGDQIVSNAGFGPGWPQTGLQEYAVSDEFAGFKVPEGIDLAAASTLPTSVIAPATGLFEKEKGLGIPAPWSEEAKSFDYRGTTVLIIGGGSNTGRFATQLAKIAGIGKIVVVGGASEELKSYGATDVLDRHGGDEVVLQRIRDVVGNDLVYALDVVNPPDGQILAANALSSTKKGKLARLVPMGPLDESKVQGKKAGFDVVDVNGVSQLVPHLAAPFWEKVPEYLVSGKLKPLKFVLKEGLTAENANGVLDAYRDGKKVTKTHLTF